MQSPCLRPSSFCVALGLLAQAWVLSTGTAHADNPIVQHIYTADPAPMVQGDTVYLCTSHDEDVTVDGFFTMNDWRVFSSKDMVNWTDHGSPLSYRTFSWAKGKAWAPHCVERGGKFYFYVPVSDAIGVAVADSPTGPFRDAIGRPLISNYQYIDPTVFVDVDGQAYLYFGNPKLWYVKLNADMISYSGQVTEVPMTTASFGQRSGAADRPTLYEEGPWFYKRNDLYHMMFAMGPLPERIGYSTSTSPTGPWSYKGVIMSNQSGHAFTNHAGVIDFKGRSYFFYHTQELPGGGGYKRSVAVEEFTYKADGTFPTINKTSEGVTKSVAPLLPYSRVEGETIAWGSGIEVDDCNDGGRCVTNIENGDSIKVESVEFLTGARSFSAQVASGSGGGSIELRVDSAKGTLLGTCAVPGTGGWQEYESVSCDIAEVTGIHDLYLVFKGGSGSLFNVDYWQFTPKDPLPNGSGGTGGMSGSGGSPAAGSPGGGTSAGGGGPSSGGNGGTTVSNGGTTVSNGGTTVSSGGTTVSSGGTAVSSGGTAVSSGGTTVSSGGTTVSSGGTSAPRGGSPGSGGSGPSSTAGVFAVGGAPGAAGTPSSDTSDTGCACRTASSGSHKHTGALSLFGVCAALAALRRRRRGQR